MKKSLSYLFVALVALNTNQLAKADAVDASSTALGGNTVTKGDPAFSALRNPAALSEQNGLAIILPLSTTTTIGNNLTNFSTYAKDVQYFLTKTSAQSFKSDVLDAYIKNGGQLRFDLVSITPALGLSGTPSKNIAIMGNPVSFGFNVWGKAYSSFDLNFSDGISKLLTNTNTLMGGDSPVQKQISEISSNFSKISLNTIKVPDLNKFRSLDLTNKEQINSVLDEVQQFQTDTLKPLLNTGDSIVTSFGKLDTQIKDLLKNFEDIAKKSQSLKTEIVADGHAVMAVSASSKVFKNKMMDVSFGINLKGFVLPYSTTLPNTSDDQFLKLIAPSKIPPINLKLEAKLDSLKSLTEVKKIFDEQLSPIVTQAKTVLDTTKKLDQQLSDAIPRAKENIVNIAGDLPDLQSTVLELQGQATELTKQVQGDLTQKTISGITTAAMSDLKDVKFNVSNVTDVSPFGMGIDLGLQANVMDDFIVGLMLENPVVFWPAKMRTSQIQFDTDKIASSGGKDLNLANMLKITEDSNAQAFNYNLSEPLAVKLGGAYKLGRLTPFLANATIMAEAEQVFNGRPFALHLGFEKAWFFGPAGIFARLGSQFGGTGNMVTAGLGLKGGAFNLNLGYGATNPINPADSKTALVSLSTSLTF